MIRQIYLYSVCLMTLVIGAIHAGVLSYDVVELTAPALMTNSTYDPASVESDYIGYARAAQREASIPKQSLEEYRASRASEHESTIHRERRRALKSAIRALITIGICGALFLVHWRFGRRTAALG